MKRLFCCWSAICGALLGPALAGEGEVYTYVDAEGVAHFTNVPGGEVKYRRLDVAQGKKAAVAIPAKNSPQKEMPAEYDEHVREAEKLYGLPAELIRAVMAVESRYDRHAVSRAGAQGLMQLMPETCQLLRVSDPFDPRQNILGGARYLKMLLESLGHDLELALAAYNAGLKRVTGKMAVPAIAETKNYVRRVLGLYDLFLTSSAE